MRLDRAATPEVRRLATLGAPVATLWELCVGALDEDVSTGPAA
jgi:hypothetical protein